MWWKKVRGRATYWGWQGRQHPDVVLGAVVFAASVVGIAVSFTTPAFASLLFVANAIVVLWGFMALWRFSTQHAVVNAEGQGWSEVRFEQAGGRLARGPGAPAEAAVVWPEVDVALWRSGSTIEFHEDFQLDPQARALAIPALRHHLSGAAVLFNDSKVRLDTTLTRTALDGDSVVTLRRTDYYSSLVTNELTLKEIVRTGESRDVAYDGRSFFLSGDSLLSHEHSRCSDHIGISAHAITSDGLLVSTLQAGRSAQDPGRFAPAGSGSMDWADVAGKAGCRLVDLVAASMRREVAEECDLPLDAVETPLVTGYGRLLHRGGKPEFFGVCVLHVHSRELSIRRAERPYVGDHRFHPVQLSSEESLMASLDGISRQLESRKTIQWLMAAEALRRHVETGLLGELLTDIADAPAKQRPRE